MMIFMDEKKLRVTRRKFLKASGKVAGAAVSKSGKLRGVGELILPQEASRPGIGHAYQQVTRNAKGQVTGYGSIFFEESKMPPQSPTSIPGTDIHGVQRRAHKTITREYLGEVDISDFEKTRSVVDLDFNSSGWPEGPPRNRRLIPDFTEIERDVDRQMDYEDFHVFDTYFDDFEREERAGQLRDADKIKYDHPFDSDEHGQRIKRVAGTVRKLSDKLQKVHRLQDIAKKQIQSRSQMLLEHQGQQKEIKSQKKPSQVKQKVTQAIDLAKESPKTSSIVSGLSRFSGALAGLELADMNPFNPPQLGAPGIEEWQQQEMARKRKKRLMNHQPSMEAAYP